VAAVNDRRGLRLIGGKGDVVLDSGGSGRAVDGDTESILGSRISGADGADAGGAVSTDNTDVEEGGKTVGGRDDSELVGRDDGTDAGGGSVSCEDGAEDVESVDKSMVGCVNVLTFTNVHCSPHNLNTHWRVISTCISVMLDGIVT
jgi:hypothetical protein